MADLIHLVVIIAIVLVFVVGPAILKFLIRQSVAKGGGPPQARRPGQSGPAQPADEIKNFLSAIGIQVEKPKPKPRPAQPPPSRAQQPAAEGETVYEADQDEVKQYLQSVGVKVETKQAARRPAARQARPQPQPPPPQARRPAQLAQRRPEPARVKAQPQAQQPPRKVQARRRAEPAAAAAVSAAKPARAERVEPKPARRPVAVSRGGSLGRLGAAPTMAELRRAIILAEVIGRPDFGQLPYERLKF